MKEEIVTPQYDWVLPLLSLKGRVAYSPSIFYSERNSQKERERKKIIKQEKKPIQIKCFRKFGQEENLWTIRIYFLAVLLLLNDIWKLLNSTILKSCKPYMWYQCIILRTNNFSLKLIFFSQFMDLNYVI